MDEAQNRAHGDSGKMMADHHVCAGGWICEAHPDRPWPHGDCAGPGMPCRTRGSLHALVASGRAYQAAWIRHRMTDTVEGIGGMAKATEILFAAFEEAANMGDLSMDDLPSALKKGVVWPVLDPPGAVSVPAESIECPGCHAAHVIFLVHRGKEHGTVTYHCLACRCEMCGSSSRRRGRMPQEDVEW